MGKSIAAPEKVRAASKRLRAVELRKLGFTYQKIADQMGISRTAAHKLVTKALIDIRERTNESTEELRTLELIRLDEYQLRVAQEIQKSGKPLPAIDRALRIMERRAKILGLDAPAQFAVSSTINQLIDTLSRELRSPVEARRHSASIALHRIAAGEDPVITVVELFFEMQARLPKTEVHCLDAAPESPAPGTTA